MSFIIGRGRYGREAYPSAGGAGPVSGAILQALFANVPDGQNPITTSGTYTDLPPVTVNITTGAHPLIITASASAELVAAGDEGGAIVESTIDYRVTIDGVPLPGSGFSSLFPAHGAPAPNTPQSGAVVVKTAPLAPGAHVVKLQWRCGGVETDTNQASIDPTTGNGGENASLLVEEVSS